MTPTEATRALLVALTAILLASCGSEPGPELVSESPGSKSEEPVRDREGAARLARRARQALKQDPDESRKLWEEAAAADPARVDLRLELAKVHAFHLSDDAAALPHLEWVADETEGEAPGSQRAAMGIEARHLLTRSALAKNDLETAHRRVQEALALGPNDVGSWSLLAEIQEARGDSTSARESIGKALEIEPRHTGLLFQSGRLALATGEPTEAKRQFEKALEIDPGQGAAHLSLARCLQLEGDSDAARRHIEIHRLLTLLDSKLHVDRNVGIAARQETLERLVALMPTYGTPHNELMKLYESQGRYDEAIDVMRRLSDAKPDAPNPVLQMARLYEASGNLEAAREAKKRYDALVAGQGK
ncbi:MAG: tetratricopeptide repeat protein [Planctomycetota bacterium]